MNGDKKYWWAAAVLAASALAFLGGSCWERQRPIPAEELYLDPDRQTFRRVTDVDTSHQYPVDRPGRVIPQAPTD